SHVATSPDPASLMRIEFATGRVRGRGCRDAGEWHVPADSGPMIRHEDTKTRRKTNYSANTVPLRVVALNELDHAAGAPRIVSRQAAFKRPRRGAAMQYPRKRPWFRQIRQGADEHGGRSRRHHALQRKYTRGERHAATRVADDVADFVAETQFALKWRLFGV